MDIPGIQSSDPIFGAPSDLGPSNLDKDSFLRLLVEQMQSQDPLQPTSNEDMIAQLAQFSSLEQMENLNDNILGMTVLQQNNALISQLMGGSALIGKSVDFIDPNTGEPATGEVSSVKVEDGLALLTIDGQDVPLANVREVADGPDGGQGDSSDDTDSNSDSGSDQG